MKMKLILIGALAGWAFSTNTLTAQYNECAAQNVITEKVRTQVYDAELRKDVEVIIEQPVASDDYGNAQGNQYDLAVDGAFEGQTIAVLHLYTGEGFDFKLPTAAFKEKGFSVYRWINEPPTAEALKEGLDKACQLWVVSSHVPKLSDEHIAIIKAFFDSGRGVYILGDNAPFYADANRLGEALIGANMQGNVPGGKVVHLQSEEKQSGLIPNHLISTGIQNIYEGITIATIDDHHDMTPLIYGTANNLVTAAYEKDGKRLVFDGGFTRLFIDWDSAGSGRFVKNAAAWLVNYERFGDEVLAESMKEETEE
jgi:hypothetical protein